jgi:signal transduction histidine kinase
MHPTPCQENLLRRAVRALAGRLKAMSAARDRLLWAVRVRWLVIGGFLGLAVAAHGFGLFGSIRPCLAAAVVGMLMNGANAWCLRRNRLVSAVTAVAIPLDHLLITYVVVNTGGVQSPFVMMFVVQVLATAMLVDTVIAAISALFGMAVWAVGIGLLTAGALDAPALFASRSALESGWIYSGTWAAYLLYCLALLVYLGGYISGRLRASEQDLADKNRELQAALASVRAAHGALTTSYERLKHTEAQLVQSEKMRGLGELVAGVAHELNNPISFVSANVEHLRNDVDRLRQALAAYAEARLPAEERTRLEVLRRELRIEEALADLPSLLDDCEEGARRSKRIIAELREFSRRDARDAFRTADLHRGLDRTLALLSHRFKDRIRVHRDFGDVPHVECRPDQMNQVFLNLLANAVDAIGENPGNIWITTRLVDAVPAFGVTPPAVVISIRDDGIGMPHAVQARVFEPFFTTKEVGRGTGLGLSVSYGIVERHDGRLTVASEPGLGATFTITLPLAHDADAVGTGRGGRTVL